MPRRQKSSLTAASLRPWLESCGYAAENLLPDLLVDDGRTAALAGFSQRPFDSRSACVVAIDVTRNRMEDARACRNIGAPVALLCQNSELIWWKQGETDSGVYQKIPSDHLEGFFREHRRDLDPSVIYRAKTLGRFESSHQREFVDLGLMPAVEKEMGSLIERLLLDQVSELRETLGWPKDLSAKQGQWLVKSIFWLLGAKMLHDKRVEGFIRLDFSDVESVFDRVSRHYGQSAEAVITSQNKLKALQSSADAISKRADLRLASTEALAYVYENTLITREVRKGLGTHSTPSYLIDYMVGRLAPWIQEMPPDSRSVFEPACGHGGFLVSSVRLLTSLLPPDKAAPEQRKKYLRQRVRGCDKDSFALEIARLSLTLTDIPNPNGWRLQEGDAFASNMLELGASSSSILLANPPFELFDAAQRDYYGKKFQLPQFVSKATEILHRSVSALPDGGVFGLVIPQNILHSKDSRDFREMLSKQAELEEICLFPDKVFNFASVESGILIGRKITVRSDNNKSIRYRRVREGEIELFREKYETTSDVLVSSSKLSSTDSYDFRVPDLEDIWEYCSEMPELNDFVKIGRGFSHLGIENKKFPAGQKQTSSTPLNDWHKGYNSARGMMTHQAPSSTYMNLSQEVISVARMGLELGTPRVLCNYSPARRKCWCVTASMDEIGVPANDRFSMMQPVHDLWTTKIIWSIVNSPVGNAYAHTHSSKRHLLLGMWYSLPVPNFSSIPEDLILAIDTYLDVASNADGKFVLSDEADIAESNDRLKKLHWKIDAEVLKLYGLPVKLEKKLLEYFSGVKRVGVPFKQDRYFPEDFDVPISLEDYIAITTDWEVTNTRRIKLIDQKLEGELTKDKHQELTKLKHLADVKSQLVMPLPIEELARQEADLRRRGVWKGV